jgi:hypothetical protein
MLKEHSECKVNLANRMKGGSTSPKRNRDPATRASSSQDMFMLVDENGDPMPSVKSEKAVPYRVYYAKKPSLAAVKAYYALIRSTKPQQMPMSSSNIEEIEKEALKIEADDTVVQSYMQKVRQAKSEPPSYIRLRRPDENKVRTYFVAYERVLKPNKHEIDKGIVKVAVAKIR